MSGSGSPAEDAGPAEVADAVREGVALYNRGRFWDAHEALERVWRKAPQSERDLWQGLIQAAAAMLHRERGNRHGLLKQGGAAIEKLRLPAPPGFPVETARFVPALEECVYRRGPVPRMRVSEVGPGTPEGAPGPF